MAGITDGKKSVYEPGAAMRARLRGDVDALVEMVSNGDVKTRVLAAGELRRLRDPRAVPALVQCLEGRADEAGKISALKALRAIGDSRAAASVFAVASDRAEPFGVRGTAANTLLSFGDRRGVTITAGLFGETTAEHHAAFRKWALPLLVEAKGTEALPALRSVRSNVGVLERRRLDRAIRTLERLQQ